MKYYIGDIGFTSIEKCKRYVRDILNNLGCCTIDKNHSQYEFFNNLLKNHSQYEDKKGVGIKNFNIRVNRLNRSCYETYIIRNDGSEIDFSWTNCCGYKRPDNYNLIMAMRSAIEPYTTEFRNNSMPLICQLCKIMETIYHVDHKNPSFKVLVDKFLLHNLPPNTFNDCPNTNRAIFKENDEKFKATWIEYHNLHAELQILCQMCNLKKSKK